MSIIICPECGKECVGFVGLGRHYFLTHHKTVPIFTCRANGCVFKAWSKDELREHIKLEHTPLHCPDCGQGPHKSWVSLVIHAEHSGCTIPKELKERYNKEIRQVTILSTLRYFKGNNKLTRAQMNSLIDSGYLTKGVRCCGPHHSTPYIPPELTPRGRELLSQVDGEDE